MDPNATLKDFIFGDIENDSEIPMKTKERLDEEDMKRLKLLISKGNETIFQTGLIVHLL